MKKLRLIFRSGVQDYNGTNTGYTYSTYIVEIPSGEPALRVGDYTRPELIGGEWLKDDEVNKDNLIDLQPGIFYSRETLKHEM